MRSHGGRRNTFESVKPFVDPVKARTDRSEIASTAHKACNFFRQISGFLLIHSDSLEVFDIDEVSFMSSKQSARLGTHLH